MNNELIILSDAIQSGKTSSLQKLIARNISITGFITPDYNGLRQLIDLEQNKVFAFQKVRANNNTDICIGKFIFDINVFNSAHQILNQLHLTKNEIIIIDEIGKLEIDNLGFEPALSLFLSQIKFLQNKKIIIVVRESLLQQCIQKYNLQNAIILDNQGFKTQYNL